MGSFPPFSFPLPPILLIIAAIFCYATGCDSSGGRPDSSSKPRANQSPSESAAAGPTPLARQGKVTITWGTESEQECYGYFVWRATTKKGPFEKVNTKMVPGGGTTHVPRRYRVVDQPLPMGATYYYKVEQIDLTGMRREITPVVPCTVTQPADPEDKEG